jgi:hypothetical protein
VASSASSSASSVHGVGEEGENREGGEKNGGGGEELGFGGEAAQVIKEGAGAGDREEDGGAPLLRHCTERGGGRREPGRRTTALVAEAVRGRLGLRVGRPS